MVILINMKNRSLSILLVAFGLVLSVTAASASPHNKCNKRKLFDFKSKSSAQVIETREFTRTVTKYGDTLVMHYVQTTYKSVDDCGRVKIWREVKELDQSSQGNRKLKKNFGWL